MNDVEPYASPETQSQIVEPATLTKRVRRRGPAIPIAVGTTIGGVLGLPLLIHKNAFGLVGMFLGSALGGLYFRFRSSNWPTDPTARRRRYGYAMLTTLLFPTVPAISTGMRGQGLAMTVLALLIGLSIATGILLSGDRRSGDVA